MISVLYARLIGVALIVAAIAGGYFYVHHLQTTIATLTADKIVLTTKLQEQNAAIAQLKIDSDKRIADGKTAVAAAQAIAAKNKSRATVIYKTLPSVPGKDCSADRISALNLINGAK